MLKTMNVKEANVLMSSRERSMDMCSGPLFSKILIFALPIMAMYILQLMFNTADMIVVGHFSGSRALAAVGATGSLINLIITLFMGLSVGTTVIVAQHSGADQPEDVRKSVHTSIISPLLFDLVRDLAGTYKILSLYSDITFLAAIVPMLFVANGDGKAISENK